MSRSLIATFLFLSSTCVHSWIITTRKSIDFASSRKRITKSVGPLRSSESDSDNALNIEGKDIYQRVFYRLSSGSQVDNYKAMVVEELVRFEPDGSSSIKPIGHRTLILRDGDVEDGEIGDILFKMDVNDGTSTHGGAGYDRDMDCTICTALYLASNPKFLEGNVLELSADLGLASLLGCVGAGTTSSKSAASSQEENTNTAADSDILSIPKHDTLLPKIMEMLTLSDANEDRLNLAFHNVKNSNVPATQVELEEFDWSIPIPVGMKTPAKKNFHTIVGCNLDLTFPTTKQLARTVAYRLEPSSSYYMTQKDYNSQPCFVHVSPDNSDQMVNVRNFLQKGYKMDVSTGYIKMEKIIFNIQMMPHGEPEEKLDDIDLEVQEYKELIFESCLGYHSLEYDTGMGEYFFPMDNGQFEAGGAAPYGGFEAPPGGSSSGGGGGAGTGMNPFF